MGSNPVAVTWKGIIYKPDTDPPGLCDNWTHHIAGKNWVKQWQTLVSGEQGANIQPLRLGQLGTRN